MLCHLGTVKLLIVKFDVTFNTESESHFSSDRGGEDRRRIPVSGDQWCPTGVNPRTSAIASLSASVSFLRFYADDSVNTTTFPLCADLLIFIRLSCFDDVSDSLPCRFLTVVKKHD